MDATDQIELVIADDNSLVLEQMSALLNLEEDFKVIGQARNGLELVELVKECTPDIVLLDLKMPYMDGFEATQRLKEKYPEMRVIILTMYDNDQYRAKAKKIGVDAYLVKGSPLTEILDTIKESFRKTI